MKKEIRKIYNTEVEILEATIADIVNEAFAIENEPLEGEILLVHQGEVKEVKRQRDDFYILGYRHDKHGMNIAKDFIYAKAKQISTKEITNLLISLGADQVVASPCDVDKVIFKEAVQEEDLEVAKMVDEGGTHPKEEEKAVTEKPKTRKRNRKTVVKEDDSQ